ncbi:hypothetical protein PTKIN_Ptkin13bG0198200 [Pterospermum kingtungense]
MFKCIINVHFISDKPEPDHESIPSYITENNSYQEFEHRITNDQLTLRNFISSLFSDARIISFPLGNLHWKEPEYDKESVPSLMSMDDVVTSIFDVCHRMVRESSRKKLFLIVLVRKHVIVPHDEYLAMVKARKRQEVLSGVKRLHARGRNLSQWELMDNELREARFWRRETLKLVRKHAKRESTEEALEVKFVPAAETAIQALEKVTPKHSEENQRHHGFVKCCVPFLAKKTKYLEEKCWCVLKRCQLVLNLLACLARMCFMEFALFDG